MDYSEEFAKEIGRLQQRSSFVERLVLHIRYMLENSDMLAAYLHYIVGRVQSIELQVFSFQSPSYFSMF
jgi:hypothetical protein